MQRNRNRGRGALQRDRDINQVMRAGRYFAVVLVFVLLFVSWMSSRNNTKVTDTTITAVNELMKRRGVIVPAGVTLQWEHLEEEDEKNNRSGGTGGLTDGTSSCSRAARLVNGDTTDGEGEFTLQDKFKEFTKKYPAWGDAKKSYVFWRDFPAVEHISADDLMVARVQESGLCYLLAPIVLQHYLVTCGSGGTEHQMINAGKFIAKEFTARQIFDHLTKEDGGPSQRFAMQIMGLHWNELEVADIRENLFLPTTEVLAARLKKYGVGLVSYMHADSNFNDGTDKCSYLDDDSNPDGGGHAMVVVGHRTHAGRHIFLLQNWWRNKQLIEVSAEYMAKSKAQVQFVTKNLEHIPETFPTIEASYAVTSVDKSATMMPAGVSSA